MISMIPPACSNLSLSLELSERLEQGVVEQSGVLDLRNMAKTRQQGEGGIRRQQRSQIKRLLNRRRVVLVTPQDGDGELHPCICGAIGTHGVAVGAEEV